MTGAEDAPSPYRVVLSGRAYHEYYLARLYVRAVSGETAMEEWVAGFRKSLASLEHMPYRSVAPESERFGRETRQLVYKAKGASYSHRIVYQIRENGDLLVMVLHLRHSSQDAISRYDAEVIETQAGFDAEVAADETG
jgi:plasmid stabilization system protein ParE